jgi:hypothetical protein
MEGGARSVFDFGAAPVPPPPKVDPIQVGAIADAQKREKDRLADLALHPPTPPTPHAPPIPLKFYGYAKTTAARQAFFLDGDDPLIKGENDIIRGRYKIIRIGINSATVEDLQFHDQQTLPLVAESNT